MSYQSFRLYPICPSQPTMHPPETTPILTENPTGAAMLHGSTALLLLPRLHLIRLLLSEFLDESGDSGAAAFASRRRSAIGPEP